MLLLLLLLLLWRVVIGGDGVDVDGLRVARVVVKVGGGDVLRNDFGRFLIVQVSRMDYVLLFMLLLLLLMV